MGIKYGVYLTLYDSVSYEVILSNVFINVTILISYCTHFGDLIPTTTVELAYTTT